MITREWSFGPNPVNNSPDSYPMVMVVLPKRMDREIVHLMFIYFRERLVERMRAMKIMILWTSTFNLTNQWLQTSRMYGCQLDNWWSMRWSNLVCWSVSKDNGKISARSAHYTMETMKNHLSRKQVVCPYSGIAVTCSFFRSSSVRTSAKYWNIQTSVLVQWSHEFLPSW